VIRRDFNQAKMGLLRSEEMKHGTVILPSNAARFYINLVGHKSTIQFQDMNAHDLHRPYKQHIQRIEDLERMLRFLTEELRKLPGVNLVRNRVEDFLASEDFTLDTLEDRIKNVYSQYIGFRDNNRALADEVTAAIEEKYVMQTAWGTLTSTINADKPVSSSLGDPLLADRSKEGMEFGNICGVLAREEQERFSRAIFRASRGNTFTHFEDIPEKLSDSKSGGSRTLEKCVFVIYFQGGHSTSLYDKIIKICSSFNVSFYDWPATKSDAQRRISSLEQVISDKKTTLSAFEKYVVDESAQLVCPQREGGNSLVENWRLFCIKEKSIYATLNMFTGGEHHLTCRADCWFPASEESEIKRILDTRPPVSIGALRVSATLVCDDLVAKGKVNPPTHFKKSEFMGAFQELVDTYGVPRYQEANPALFAIVTFPFIFGIMYGDIGHGSLLLAGGIYMLRNGQGMKQSESELVKGFYSARYLITAMGFFAVYAGLMYNDFFSMGTALFTSRFQDPDVMPEGAPQYEMVPKPWFNSLNAVDHGGHGPYPLGLDPAWAGAANELLFVNSMKMKLSVLFGVVQMLVGVALKFANSVFFKNKTDFVFECIPQLMFMLAFFGYMDWMIMYKWVTPINEDPALNGPPGIINTMITMGLGTPDRNPLYVGQPGVQAFLMKLTICAVPLMLIPKPIILWLENKRKTATQSHGARSGTTTADGEYTALVEEGGKQVAQTTAGHGEHEEFEIGEVVIHQMIETIEYVLGTVSHTASYLRLWALSLAHQQLSLVFFQKALVPALVSGPIIINGIYIYIAFTVFFGITAGVLLGMDVMECFLHTLRLHWVEFQSKFYKADGYAFNPYSHMDILKNAPATGTQSAE
jgi:V-type H+-transporting ATPase subunit a